MVMGMSRPESWTRIPRIRWTIFRWERMGREEKWVEPSMYFIATSSGGEVSKSKVPRWMNGRWEKFRSSSDRARQ